jgi:uncharacterized membrane protein YdjX (TVP38/TMEM64 family)
MERSKQSEGPNSLLFYVMAAIIIGSILAFLIIRPAHGLM